MVGGVLISCCSGATLVAGPFLLLPLLRAAWSEWITVLLRSGLLDRNDFRFAVIRKIALSFQGMRFISATANLSFR